MIYKLFTFFLENGQLIMPVSFVFAVLDLLVNQFLSFAFGGADMPKIKILR